VSLDGRAEWLEADGLGGFASGAVSGIRTRRYHALLLAATRPPAGRLVLVNGIDAWVETEAGRFALSSQCYTPDVVHPDGAARVESFVDEPWPHWSFRLDDGTRIEQELFAVHGAPVVAMCWRRVGAKAPATLTVWPFLSGRDYHSLHHENPAFRFDAEIDGERVTWRPCRPSLRSPAAVISTSPTGTGASCMKRSARAASTSSRTSRPQGPSGSTWSGGKRC